MNSNLSFGFWFETTGLPVTPLKAMHPHPWSRVRFEEWPGRKPFIFSSPSLRGGVPNDSNN
jgi:hypothetical protein